MIRFPLAAELPLPELPLSPLLRAIIGLRQGGLGYKRIARTLGLTRDEARYYARSVRLGGVRGEVPPRSARPATRRARSCARCGEAIAIRQHGRPATFCSRRCRDAADYGVRKEVRGSIGTDASVLRSGEEGLSIVASRSAGSGEEARAPAPGGQTRAAPHPA